MPWIAGDPIGVTEIVKVMATAAAKRHHQRKRLAAPSSAPDPLLVVEALWWHVRLVHCPQRTDVDTHLHGGGDAEKIDLLTQVRQDPCFPSAILNQDSPETPQTLGAIPGLTSQLLAS
jgi:hypothetical protein